MTATVIDANDEKRVLISISKNKHAVRNKAILFLGLYAGLRACEIASLKLTDVFESDFTVKREIKLTTVQTKFNKSRTVAISKKLASALVALLNVIKNKHLSAALIQSQRQSKFSPNTISQLMLTVFKRANLSNCSAHSLRRSFITRLANNAVNLRAIQLLVGHSDLSVTQKYIDVTEQQMQNAVNCL